MFSIILAWLCVGFLTYLLEELQVKSRFVRQDRAEEIVLYTCLGFISFFILALVALHLHIIEPLIDKLIELNDKAKHDG